MSRVVSTLPTIWEEDVYTVLRLLKRHVDFINDELIPAINDNADDITALKTDVANIKTQIQSISVEIDGISDTLEAYRLEFAEIKNDIDSINTKITTINSSIVTINQNITSISNNVSVLESATQALSADMVQVKSDVKSLTGIIAIQGNEIIATKADIKNLQDYDESITKTLGDLQVEFTGLQSKVNGYSDKINALENLKYNVSVLESATQALSTDMVQVKSDVKSLTGIISTQGNEIIATKADIKNLQDYDESITKTLGDLQVEFTGLQSKVNGYSDKINALENLKYVVVDTTDTWQIPSVHYNYYVTTNIPVDTLNILLPSHGPGSGIYKTQKIYITSFWPDVSGKLVLMTSSGTMRPFKIGYDSATGTGATTITIPSGLTSSTWFGELTIVYKAGDTTTNNAFVRFD